MLLLWIRSNITHSIQFVLECVHFKYHYFQLSRRILKLRYINVRLAVLCKARSYAQVLGFHRTHTIHVSYQMCIKQDDEILGQFHSATR